MSKLLRFWACSAGRQRTVLSACPPRSLRTFATAPERNAHSSAPFRMAIVGSGPAGFYTAMRVMKELDGAKVDMYEALPVPFGLARFGVAPDHPEVKNCQDRFEEVASSPDFTFVGNVSVGQPSGHADGCTVPISSLLQNYNAVVFAYGTARDRVLGIPGESELKGIYSARQFVGWYNGLPEYAGLAPNLRNGEDAVVVGQGNVALDVARMLLEDVDVLRKTDITEAALEALSKSTIKRVHVVGRRGPMQAAFTIKEVRELMKLKDVGFHPIDRSLIPEKTDSLPRSQKRMMDLILQGSKNFVDDTPKSWSLDFCLSPVKFLATGDGHVATTELEQTLLSDPYDRKATVTGSGKHVHLPSSVVFRSIGYQSVGLPGFEEAGIRFNSRKGVIESDIAGHVLGGSPQSVQDVSKETSTEALPGVYCVGWVKTGPTGVIVSTMTDAFTTADTIVRDWKSGSQFLTNQKVAGWDAIKTETSTSGSCRVIDWQDWQNIDKAEKERGSRVGKVREKFTDTAEMLSVVN